MMRRLLLRMMYTVGVFLVIFGQHIVDLTLLKLPGHIYLVPELNRTCLTCQGNTYLANICSPDDLHSDCRPCPPGHYQPEYPESHMKQSCVVNYCEECPPGQVLKHCQMPYRIKICCDKEQPSKCQRIFHGTGHQDPTPVTTASTSTTGMTSPESTKRAVTTNVTAEVMREKDHLSPSPIGSIWIINIIVTIFMFCFNFYMHFGEWLGCPRIPSFPVKYFDKVLNE